MGRLLGNGGLLLLDLLLAMVESTAIGTMARRGPRPGEPGDLLCVHPRHRMGVDLVRSASGGTNLSRDLQHVLGELEDDAGEIAGVLDLQGIAVDAWHRGRPGLVWMDWLPSIGRNSEGPTEDGKFCALLSYIFV